MNHCLDIKEDMSCARKNHYYQTGSIVDLVMEDEM